MMNRVLLYSGVALLLIAAGVAYYYTSPGTYDSFAQCLSEKDVVMYGAFWCPHCKNQKTDFGKSFKYITYIECAEPSNPNVQTQACKDAGINSYPTWEFADKTQQSGKLSMEYLSQKSGCPLPI